MTGTTCENYDYDENDSRILNSFELFSIRLFNKINKNRLLNSKPAQLPVISNTETSFNINTRFNYNDHKLIDSI